MNKLLKTFFRDFNKINNYYNYLIEKTKKLEYVGITNEWLIDNFYLLVEHKTDIVNEKKIIAKRLKKSEALYYCLKEVTEKNNYSVGFKCLVTELKQYQKNTGNYFSYQEIANIRNILVFIYTNRLVKLCDLELEKLLSSDKIKKILTNSLDKEIQLKDFIDDSFDVENNHHYIYELNAQLKELGSKSNGLFKELNEYLKEKQVSLKEIINDEHQARIENDLLISNIFNDLRSFFELSVEDLYEKVSKAERILLNDKIYAQMTVESKDLYRRQIEKLAKKNHCTELEYLNRLLDKTSFDDYHIGFQLFKNKNKSIWVAFYILAICLVTFGVSFWLSSYFIKFRLLGFLILLIPVSQLFIQLFNQILIKIVPTNPLPKLDYSKGIPEESATMVVIPTIVGDKKKIKEMFDILETFYLINKTENLYFTLLGDVKAAKEKVMPYDKELSEYGCFLASELNKKYKKDLFYFIYRKRIWDPKEDTYLGYERKRGAILQFNKILLHDANKAFLDKYFNVNMLENNTLNIKYVITLDTDTRLVLNTALNLVGAMAHPLNRPVLNKEGTKVIRGYGLMQPRVSVDIEATNKSLYSQIFAGIGGFDTYSAIVPNVYQDSFGEGSFVGKGIYDLKVFEEVLENAFPDDLILSHDLLEGNYLRCGYVCDIELIDDFPSKFLTDITRHHRWARGDVQIIGWLFNKVKNKKGQVVKNPINLLGKFKIFDNIVRMFLYPTLLLTLICGIFFSKVSPLWWIGLVVLEIAVPVVIFLRSKITKSNGKLNVYYKNLFSGGRSVLLRSYIVLATIPFYTKLYMDAFFRTMYRLLISHKNLLNWITAEEVEKTVKGDLKNYIRNFIPNIITAGLLIIFGLIFKNIFALVLALVFLSAPFILYYVSLNIDHSQIELKGDEVLEIKDVALKTWKYFEDNLVEKYYYLIPDNYQENREQKLDLRTSPTAIGYSLTSVVCAYELEFIDVDRAVYLIDKILHTVDSLEKWNGHLYNWYDIKTKKVFNPRFVSTVDSGNLAAALIVVLEFLKKNGSDELIKLCTKLIDNMNFKKLYTKKNVFSIGYDESEEKLSIYNYNKFASESRLTGYIAICLGDVPAKHWFSLDKSLTTYKGHKGLISWSGTSFEYYMPLLFMKNYPNTLLDESYRFAHFCQKDYIEGVSRSLPWGIGESAYDELDNSLNYKYKAFSTPYLKAKEDKENRIVLSPYSSIMAMELFPEDVYENMNKFKKLDMYGKYGFYEAYDYDNKDAVLAYFAHHQGMILVALTNYLKNGAIQNYFHSNVNIKTFDILLKEKVQIKTSIDMKMARYKKYDYQKEKIENDIRAFNYISYMPEVSVLSNKKYCLLMNDRGDSFSRYRTLQLNRYRKITEQDYGLFMYIKDVSTNKVWSNTYAPVNIKPDNYEVVFASDMIKYLRTDGKMMTKTEIVVTKDHHAEIRKITFKNNSDVDKILELTTYTEVILSENMDDVSHRVFNNMFVSSEYDRETNSLIMRRKGRGENAVNSYMVNRLIINNPVDSYSYETERVNFIGRGHTPTDPVAINNTLTNYSGDNLDPVMSLRNKIVVEANGTTTVYLIMGFGRSLEQIMDIVKSYDSVADIERAFRVSALMNIVNTKMLGVSGDDMRLYNIMLNYLYQTTRISVSEERMDLLRKNCLGQNGLWKFGISGDRPIILVDISDISDLPFVFDILKAFEYYKNNSIFVDIVIINNENEQYAKIINKEIEDEKYRMYSLNSFYHTPGSINVIDGASLTREEISLFNIVPRLKFVIKDHISFKEAVEELQKNNKISLYDEKVLEENIPIINKEKLVYDNGFGGFKNNGREYVIYNKNTPTPWSNVIANKNFGTVVTNNGCGFTYAYNSGEFKITSWSNDIVVNDKSEGFKFNDKIFDPEKCTHGFGYSILECESKDLKKEVTEFVAVDDPAKIYLVNLTNKTNKKLDLDVNYWINPTFGNFEEKTARHILSEFMGEENYLKLRNVYSINYGDVCVYMSSSEKINYAVSDRILVKSVGTKISLAAAEEKMLVFVLCSNRDEKVGRELVKKYTDINNAKRELKLVKAKWEKELGVIQVKSPDKSFNYMINGWYLYQTLSSRIFAKAGFYQVSGAFGYRDQLQDSMNVVLVHPDVTRKQILINAAHQFEEGDVLHWWHEINHFGLRSRYKDDYLWLVLVVCNYIEVTNDYTILSELVPYVMGDKLSNYEQEKGITFRYTENSATILEHCLKSLQLAMSSLGSHKIPLMGGGDWNDGMNKVGSKGKGESVWLGFFLYDIIEKFVKMMHHYDKTFDGSSYLEFNEKLKESLNKKAWDGEYYLRAFFDNGDKLGSHENSECKIDLISQSFAILSGVASKERTTMAIDAVEEHLVDKNKKIIKLLTPPFEKSLNNPGYIMNYAKGIRENGGQYTHSVAWYIMALIKAGYHDLAYKYYQMINPVERSLDSEDVNTYKVEPYVIAADIYSAENYPARGGWTWYTGSAGWFYNVGISEILGLKKHGNTLKIVSSIPVAWDSFKVVYNYMETVYNIEVIKDNNEEIKVDGVIIKGSSIKLANDKKEHEVIVHIR
ncbi:MAG: glucoamylase family protein [bacterium]|nr:glucoamylase family protein [bacterium]